MPTNQIDVTNVVTVLWTNAQPVSLVMDWGVQQAMFWQGFNYGCSVIAAWAVVKVVYRVMTYRGDGFPKD